MTMNTEAKLKVLMKLKVLVKKLQRGLIAKNDDEEEEEGARNNGVKMVAGDVKKGHFAVIAGQGEEAQKFMIELDYLSDPAFVKLLQQAEEEYGFQQQGVLAVPCRPQELQTILGSGRRSRRRRSTEW